MIGVTAKLIIHPDKRETFEAVMNDLSARVKANEPGCIFYQLVKSRANENTYLVMEAYSGVGALETHREADHFTSVQGDIGACLAEPADIQVYDWIE